jgi:hypothetical protein
VGIVGNEWKNVPFFLNVTLDERVLPTELPMHLGKSTSLDKQIAAILQTGQAEQYYLDGEQLIGIPFPVGFDGESTTWVELEIEGMSSGYYDAGCCSGPPDGYYPEESDDERIITVVKAVFHDEHYQVLGQLEMADEAKLYEIYEADLPDNYY